VLRLGGAFEKKYRCYNKDFGRTNILPHERPRFIKDRLNYRKHDLPHAHNPVTDFFVPSFTGFPLPARGVASPYCQHIRSSKSFPRS